MESDNLQMLWQSQVLDHEKKEITQTSLDTINTRLQKSRQKMLKTIQLEIVAGLVIYICAGLFLFLSQLEKKELFFAVKIMLLIAVYAVPTTMHLYQSISKLTITNFAIPLNAFLSTKIEHLRKAFRMYLLMGVLTCIFLLIALLTDEFFLSTTTSVKVASILYILLFAILLSPILHIFYGREIKQLQKQLQELK